MPLALQCLGNLNRAGRWQAHSKLQSTRRASSVPSSSRAFGVSGLAEGHPTRRKGHSTLTQFLKPPLRSSSSFSAAAPNNSAQPSNRQALPTTVLKEYSEEELDWVDLPARQRRLRVRDKSAREDPVSQLDLAGQGQCQYDISFWARQLARSQRKDGDKGVLRIWRIVDKRRALVGVNGPEADFFWNTILNAALAHDFHLEEIHAYADWLLEMHDAMWPDLYIRVVSHCLGKGQHQRAFRWHLRLIANFDPGVEAFGTILRDHIDSLDHRLQATLQSLYMTSLHRSLYDVLIPRLYERGMSLRCTDWRDFLLRFYDVPRPNPAAQPFLRFLAGYYPNKNLVIEEQVVAGIVPAAAPRQAANGLLLSREIPPIADAETGNGPGKTRRFNDSLGAKWFASSWIPLDFAIHALQGVNVHAIGPLSLQSLALRESSASAIRSRLEQLQKLNIDIGQSNYVKAICHFAATDNDELLTVLLQSDIHPDVFDDFETQKQILDMAAANGDGHISQLLLNIQTVVAQDSLHDTSNQLLRDHLVDGDMDRAVRLMDDMRAMDIDMAPPTTDLIHRQLLELVPWDIPFSAAYGRWLLAAIDLARRASATKNLVPAKVWQNILFNSGKYGRLETMETLAIQLVDDFQQRGSDLKSGGLVSVHRFDSPASAIIGAHASASSLEIPVDLPIAHNWHPIRRIFVSRDLQAAIVRFGFNKGLIRAKAKAQAQTQTQGRSRGRGNASSLVVPQTVSSASAGLRPADFYMARGVRLLKDLRDRGIPIDKRLVREEVISCLAASGIASGNSVTGTPSSLEASREDDLGLDLADVTRLFNAAFGEEILPGPLKLRDSVSWEKARREMDEWARSRNSKLKPQSGFQW